MWLIEKDMKLKKQGATKHSRYESLQAVLLGISFVFGALFFVCKGTDTLRAL